MEGALIGVIKALVGAFVSARFADKEQKRSEASVWTAVIDSTSETPMGMHEKPFNDEIPTSEGYRLEQVLEGHTDVCQLALSLFQSKLESTYN